MIQHPVHATHIKAPSTDGNVKIVKNMECQLGTADKWYNSYVCLCHGDLGTQEHHDVTTSFHSIKKSGKNHLQWLIPIPGMSIFKWLQLMLSGECTLGIKICERIGEELFHMLCPKDSLKLATNPGYHMLNDGLQHLIKTHLLVCWEHITGVSDLTAFAKTEPKWDDVEEKAREILCEYIGGQDFQAL